jgi:outer membrane protein
MKRLIIVMATVVGILSWIHGAHSAEGLKIAYLDAQVILDRTTEGQRAKETMETYRDSRQKIIDLEENEIKKLQDNLARQKDILSPEAKRNKEETLQKKFVAYQRKVSEMTRELESKKKDILEEFNKGLLEVVKHIAEKKGYTMVFDRNSEGGVLLYAPESLDITEEVIKEYDRKTP